MITASSSAMICPKLWNCFPLRLNISTLLPRITVRTRTPSSFISICFLPIIFFSWLAESCAREQVNTGTHPGTTLFTVFSLTPQRRSLIRIRRYQSFHCSVVAVCIHSSIASRAACPVSSRFCNCSASILKLLQARPCPFGVRRLPPWSVSSQISSLIGTCFTPNVTRGSSAIFIPSKNSGKCSL